MGKPKRNKSKKGFNYDTDRKRLNKKRKQVPDIKCEQLKVAWDRKASVATNFYHMGLAANPNKTIKIQRPKETLTPMEIEGVEIVQPSKLKRNRPRKKAHVADDLETFANRPLLKTFSLPESELAYMKYMMDKHGEDYRAMAKDLKNHYQDTPKQLKQKAKKYQNSRSRFKNKLENGPSGSSENT